MASRTSSSWIARVTSWRRCANICRRATRTRCGSCSFARTRDVHVSLLAAHDVRRHPRDREGGLRSLDGRAAHPHRTLVVRVQHPSVPREVSGRDALRPARMGDRRERARPPPRLRRDAAAAAVGAARPLAAARTEEAPSVPRGAEGRRRALRPSLRRESSERRREGASRSRLRRRRALARGRAVEGTPRARPPCAPYAREARSSPRAWPSAARRASRSW